MFVTSLARVAVVLFSVGVIVLSGPWGAPDLRLQPGKPGLSVDGGDTGRGEALYRKLDCMRCHSEPRTAVGTNAPATLLIAGTRAPAHWLATYLRDPKPLRYASEGVLPRLRMPGFSLTETEAADLAAFLAIQKDPILVPPRPDIVARLGDARLIAEGRTLFEEYQCLGCHQIGDQGSKVGPPLDRVGTRRTPEYVAALLENPDRIVPGTAMKNHDLWDEEIESLTVYLLTLQGP